jgi:hypothetical protein
VFGLFPLRLRSGLGLPVGMCCLLLLHFHCL